MTTASRRTVLTVAFAMVSLLGTAASGWVLGEAISPERGGPLVGPLSLGMVLALLAVVIEGMRLALSLLGERIWRGSQFQGIAFAGPLWLACTGYCTLMPLLALAFVPLLPVGSHMLTVAAPAWAAVQIAAGLLPGITWSGPEASVAPEKVHPAPSPECAEFPRLSSRRPPLRPTTSSVSRAPERAAGGQHAAAAWAHRLQPGDLHFAGRAGRARRPFEADRPPLAAGARTR